MIVLCIDDDPEDIAFFCDAVKDIDPSITCLTASGGEEALDLLLLIKSVRQLPDYIFLDINMPRMNGEDTLKEIRKNSRYNAIQVVILSTGLDSANFGEYSQLGANHFMSKANTFESLRDRLKSFLKKSAII